MRGCLIFVLALVLGLQIFDLLAPRAEVAPSGDPVGSSADPELLGRLDRMEMAIRSGEEAVSRRLDRLTAMIDELAEPSATGPAAAAGAGPTATVEPDEALVEKADPSSVLTPIYVPGKSDSVDAHLVSMSQAELLEKLGRPAETLGGSDKYFYIYYFKDADGMTRRMVVSLADKRVVNTTVR